MHKARAGVWSEDINSGRAKRQASAAGGRTEKILQDGQRLPRGM